jgi:hypothetical protein
MTQAVEILTELQRRGVAVTLEGETLCLKPKRALDADLLARVREAKPALSEALRTQAPCGSPHCAGCYDVGEGRKIHPPKPSREWLDWLARWHPKGERVQ